MLVTFLLAVGFPAGLIIYFYRRHKISVKAVLVGALMFFIFQVVLRIPALTILQSQSWYGIFAAQNMVLTGIVIAFTAGLFETAGRYLGLRFILKNLLDRKNGIAYGIGHGGIEAVLLVGMAYAGYIVYSILINTGSISSQLVPQLLNTPPDIFLAAGVERVFTIFFHIAAALLVTYGIIRRKWMYIVCCIVLHTLVDGVTVILQIYKFSAWSIELWVAFIGVLSLVFILKSKKMFLAINSGNTGADIENNEGDLKNGEI